MQRPSLLPNGLSDLIATAATGRTVIIVSNNSSYAILEYLAIHQIGPIAGVAGRYANKPGKVELLTQAGADTVTTGLDEFTTALRLTPRPAPD